MNKDGNSSLANVLSLSRPLLGAAVFVSLLPSAREAAFVLPVVLVACFSDWLDGTVARRGGGETLRGRVIDNLCDFAFLMLVFAALARAEVWSPPVWGRFVRHWAEANWLPVLALLASFGSYALRAGLDIAAGREPRRSARGHAAGLANYALVVAGAAELWPGIDLGPWLLEPAFVSVAFLNFFAVGENVVLMFHREGNGPRMPA